MRFMVFIQSENLGRDSNYTLMYTNIDNCFGFRLFSMEQSIIVLVGLLLILRT